MKKMRNKQGFSLLEVMVVVFLMALISSVAVIKLGVGQNTLLESEAKQFVDKLELLRDESILSASVHRIVVDTDRHEYEYQQFTDKWTPLSNKPFEKHVLNEDMALDLTVSSNEEGQESTISIGSDGITSDFDLSIGTRSNRNSLNLDDAYWVVKGGHTVSVDKVDGSL